MVFTLIAGLVFTRLGFWQLSRLAERQRLNAAAQSLRTLPAIALDLIGSEEIDLTNRRVRLAGRYDRSREIVLRDYALGGVPGVRIVTPLRSVFGDTATLILRGFVPAPDAMTPTTDSLEEPGELQVEGVALPLPDTTGGDPIERNGRTTWRRLDLKALRFRIPYPIRETYVVAAADSSGMGGPGRLGFPRRVEPPALDEGQHLSYAIQWFAFAVTAVAVGGIVGRRKD